MSKNTTKPVRMRGYRITSMSLDWTASSTPTMWRQDAPLTAWETITSDPNVRYARLIESGKTIASYEISTMPKVLA